MKTQENLELIRKACIAANPEIGYVHYFPVGENKCLGCGVQRKWVDRKTDFLETHKEGGSYREVTVTEYDETGKPCPKLGREPRLADVLVVIGKIETWGHGWARIPDRELAELCFVHWNLLKDNLSEQSDETINFLAELLK